MDRPRLRLQCMGCAISRWRAPGPGIMSSLLGGSWVVVSGVISRVTIAITYIRGVITPLMTTHEPPSSMLACLYMCR